jgi:ABC-2 type transport system ATP-binding protein
MQGLMETVAEEGTTVVLSSHLIADLERVCDRLMILTHGRMRVADDIETLINDHKIILGPRRARIAGVAEIIEERGTERQTLSVARLDGAVLDPTLEVRDVELEDLVLAYLGEPPAPHLTDASRVAG